MARDRNNGLKTNRFDVSPLDLENPLEDLSETFVAYSHERGKLQSLMANTVRLEADMLSVRAKLYLAFKEDITDSGRPPSNDTVEEMIQDDFEYKEVIEPYQKAKLDQQEQEAYVKVLEWRMDILRSATASRRVESKY